jgi:HD-GYP domain-containing protein (c-di-GMP phosphodiesterase class II)
MKNRATARQVQAKSLIERARQELSDQGAAETASVKPTAYEVISPDTDDRGQHETEMSEVRISPLVMKQAKVASDEEDLKPYAEMVSFMKEVLQVSGNDCFIDTAQLNALTEKMVGQLGLNNGKLYALAFAGDWKDEDYLPYHSINVCILSIEVGLGLGYSRPELVELGVSALLHDIGMTEYAHLSNQPRKLTADEHDQIKEHTAKGREILEMNRSLGERVLHVSRQHHMRLDGSGYPEEPEAESIDEYSRIVGLADVYEAMVHPRVYRDKFLPLEAMQEILRSKKGFEHRLIKILIEKIGIYPIGSLVELNTKETAEVIELDNSAHLRPVAKFKIIRDADGGSLKLNKVLDMTARTGIHIKKVMLRKKLTAPPSSAD